jgi:hypothetical protein
MNRSRDRRTARHAKLEERRLRAFVRPKNGNGATSRKVAPYLTPADFCENLSAVRDSLPWQKGFRD